MLFRSGSTIADVLNLNLSVAAVGETPTIKTYWITSHSGSYRDNTVTNEQSFFAKVTVDATSSTFNSTLKVSITTGLTIFASEAVTLSGGYTGQLVGSISG